MIEMRATCRGKRCGRDILMSNRLDETRGPHPYDYPLKDCPHCKGKGKVRETVLQGDMFADVTDRPREVDIDCRKCKGRGKIWISHFTTCANAQHFRDKAKAKREAETGTK